LRKRVRGYREGRALTAKSSRLEVFLVSTAAASPAPQLDAEREEKLRALGYIE
jgi:hypothetical protein